MTVELKPSSGYASIGALDMYFEVQGSGEPLVYIPPAFGHAGLNRLPALALTHSVITVDLQGHMRSWNLGAQLAFGYTAEQALDMDIAELFRPEPNQKTVPKQQVQLELLRASDGQPSDSAPTTGITVANRRINSKLSSALISVLTTCVGATKYPP